MRKNWLGFMALLTILFCTSTSGRLLDNDPFLTDEGVPIWAREREVLLYKISFFGIPAGYAEFTTSGEVEEEGEKRYHIHARIWTSGLVKVFKEINDDFDFFVDTEKLLPRKAIVKQRESNKKVDKIVIYYQETGKMVHYSLDGKVISERQAVPEIYEPITVAYYLRTLDFMIDQRKVKVYGGKKLYDLDLKISGRERVQTEIGIFDTIKINPVITREGKVSHGRDVTAWLIDDGSNIPLLVHAKLKVGTLTGDLIKFSKGGLNGQ